MQSVSLLRAAARSSTPMLRAAARPAPLMAVRSVAAVNFSTSAPRRSEHAEETFEEFTARLAFLLLRERAIEGGRVADWQGRHTARLSWRD